MADLPPPGGPIGGAPTSGPAPGWWQASDGNCYPPEQQPGSAPAYGAPTGYGYGYAATGAPAGTNGMAIASLCCSLGSFLTGFTWLLGIIFGHIALSQIRRTGQEGRGLAIAGLVVGYGCLALLVLLVGLLFAVADGFDGSVTIDPILGAPT